jgi:TIR domain
MSAGPFLDLALFQGGTGSISALLLVLFLAVFIFVSIAIIRNKLRGLQVASPSPAEKPPRKDSSATPAIFISYRREDASDVTGRIYDRLIQHFGRPSVFKDVDSIPLGVDFRKHLADSVGRCDVLITVIGRQWLIGDVGQRRLDDVRDFVRIEIEAALQRDIPVVPVLVQAAEIPRLDDLPETLQSLVYRHGIPVRPDPDFHQDVDRLIKGIEGYLRGSTPKSDLPPQRPTIHTRPTAAAQPPRHNPLLRWAAAVVTFVTVLIVGSIAAPVVNVVVSELLGVRFGVIVNLLVFVAALVIGFLLTRVVWRRLR